MQSPFLANKVFISLSKYTHKILQSKVLGILYLLFYPVTAGITNLYISTAFTEMFYVLMSVMSTITAKKTSETRKGKNSFFVKLQKNRGNIKI